MSDDLFQPPPEPGGGGSSFLDWQLDRNADAGRQLLHLNRETGDGGRQVIHVAGEVDLVTAPDLRAAIDECVDAGARHVVLDLRNLAFIDSTGLAVLVGATKRLRQHDGDLSIDHPGEMVRRALEITGLSRYITVEGEPPADGSRGPAA